MSDRHSCQPIDPNPQNVTTAMTPNARADTAVARESRQTGNTETPLAEYEIPRG